MTASLDDVFVENWLVCLGRPESGRIPVTLLQRWGVELLGAVQQAREPARTSITGRFERLNSYLGGVAAGLAAGIGTSPASDAGDSDPIILAAGLLAGAAALAAGPAPDGYEVAASRAAASAAVDSAASGVSLEVVIATAARAADRVRPRAAVTVALTALNRSLHPPAGESIQLFVLSLVLEQSNPADELDAVALGAALEGLCDIHSWTPTDTGYHFELGSTLPGPVLETMWSFGRIHDLSVRYVGVGERGSSGLSGRPGTINGV